MLTSHDILILHDRTTTDWHRAGADQNCSSGDQKPSSLSPAPSPLATLALQHHRANYDLWHQEDQARDPGATDHTITEVKHAIDRLNQLRNDLAEQIDQALLAEAGGQNLDAPLNSESPGLILDRLSILALKLYHTAEEAHRSSATPEHRDKNDQRLLILTAQRADLALCLDQLWADILAGRRRFKLYRQMKMYNDPDLNPVLYQAMTPKGS